MKKLAIITLLGLSSTAVLAAPVGETFTGFGTGVELTTTKYKDSKRATGVGLIVDYGMDYGNNLVGLVEGKVKLNSSKLEDKSSEEVKSHASEKFRGSISYLQGYRVLPDLLPYVKVGYTFTKFKSDKQISRENFSSKSSISETNSGFGFGAGVKYAVSSNVELGAEYLRTRTKQDNTNINGNTFGASAAYRF
ncbi:hypothetical protein A6B43_05425 [Vespertiliibacter pulmonis]|uniref:Outer membrane autotransporter protein n=1 Tax=Vespertiliibacter pulmonis TaxID=1443036 RepID=A0A3N4W6B9_9PAST|nr:porin family protein [Vespertiliibacter pulmonis]QLB20994.1 hypothetical protein A6B43_05425 [Vespertiliibacter pulmonis]RPE80754.1 outer membrane autotransporter protein [Vespertiliibacter pulmonis]